ncbi:MAG TPA: DNA-3-methyladenine glycosylase 2 family protein [Actinomycetota bacterium]|nr:DNA-3-methyladenine glycosylase 2 family protein [Actinomycetota bacterium]
MLERRIRLGRPIDLKLTLGPLVRGRSSPSVRIDDGAVWRAALTPDGAGTQLLSITGDVLEVRAWGPGAPWLLETAPAIAGLEDDAERFDPPPGIVRDLARRMPGLRLPATRCVMEVLVPTILEQKVVGVAARRSYRGLMAALGEPAPGPRPGLFVPPEPARLAELPYWELHRFDVERRRADAIRAAAANAARLEDALRTGVPELRRRLLRLPGIGEWTCAIVARLAAGDSDAVEEGDFNLPNTITWALAGEERGDHGRMLELLEPYRGQRARAVRLIEASGVRAPRRRPRLPIEAFAAR